MHANRLQMGPTFRDKVTDSVRKFNIKHKRLRFLGFIYAMIVLTFYELGVHFARNLKRYTCLASMLFFFISSSSFTYPQALSLNVSFVSDFDREEDQGDYYTADSLEATTSVSDAVLADKADVDMSMVVADEIQEGTEEVISDEFYSIDDFEESDTEEADGALAKEDGAGDEFSASDWKIILVNKQHPIPDDYEFPLGNINATMNCDQRVIAPLKEMLKAASNDGIGLVICSPYRDLKRQEGLFAKKIAYYMDAGFSYMDAYNLSSQAVTVPGSSEHQIGLAFDIVCGDYYQLDEGFGETPAGKWLAENSYKYGFCLRYLKGKENITGIEYEPWHFRYVGVDAATVMHDNDLCLEEFWDLYLYE
ncbi:MAG: D-alanyl-D-alanine carboxypeptidase family protein [Butyrivibrio sp.]|nr:D-alanyl-D-alanine carboxypeptidase family protein [Butyrivibrio sp.]